MEYNSASALQLDITSVKFARPFESVKRYDIGNSFWPKVYAGNWLVFIDEFNVKRRKKTLLNTFNMKRNANRHLDII